MTIRGMRHKRRWRVLARSPGGRAHLDDLAFARLSLAELRLDFDAAERAYYERQVRLVSALREIEADLDHVVDQLASCDSGAQPGVAHWLTRLRELELRLSRVVTSDA